MRPSRRIYLINPSFQYRIMAIMAVLALAPISVFFAAHTYFFWKLRQLGINSQLNPDHIYYRFLDGQSHQLLMIFIFCSIIAMIFVLVFGLLVSHRIAGPIHRLKMHLSQVSEGKEVRELSFRKGDYFTEVPALVNQALTALKNKK